MFYNHAKIDLILQFNLMVEINCGEHLDCTSSVYHFAPLNFTSYRVQNGLPTTELGSTLTDQHTLSIHTCLFFQCLRPWHSPDPESGSDSNFRQKSGSVQVLTFGHGKGDYLETFWRIELLGQKKFSCRKAAEKMTRSQKYLQIFIKFGGDIYW